MLANNCKVLQKVVLKAQYINGVELPAIQDLYTKWCQRMALEMFKDSSYPRHRLFSPLLHGKQYHLPSLEPTEP